MQRFFARIRVFADLAQLVEQFIRNEKVASSIPAIGTSTLKTRTVFGVAGFFLLRDIAPVLFDGHWHGPIMGDMEQRIVKLEEFVGEARTELRAIDVRLTKIETRLETTATKADVQDSVNALIKWIVATSALLGVAAITVMTFVLNNAVPKPANTQFTPASPIIITVPVPSGAALPSPPTK